MRTAEVPVRRDQMAKGYARRAAPSYQDDVLGPLARRVEAPPEGGEDDDAETNEANLRGLLDSLPAKVLGEMKGDRLAESVAEARVQAALIGRAATPRVEATGNRQ